MWTPISAGLASLLLCQPATTARADPPPRIVHRAITSADTGPDIDPAELAARPFNGMSRFSTFRTFMSSSFAFAGVWVYAEDDDPQLYDTPVVFTWPAFYRPTWGQVFDHVARQMRGRWEWNPDNRQFRFSRSDQPPFFGVTLAPGWEREDRGLYTWHAPEQQHFGMDIYYYGYFTPSDEQDDLYQRVREHYAKLQFSRWPGGARDRGDGSPRGGGAAGAVYSNTHAASRGRLAAVEFRR